VATHPVVWMGDTASQVYFLAGCPAARKLPPERLTSFASAGVAEVLGYARLDEEGC
jgi:hypothetical protein